MKLRRPGLLVLTALACCGLMGLSGTSPAGAAKPKCTIKGTKGPDRLAGTKGRDVICGFKGDDVLIGRGGNDLLIGGPGDDRLLGLAGTDRILGQAGKDTIRGGSGPDTLFGHEGDDKLLGEPQNDFLSGGPGDDFLDGGSGTNRIDGGAGVNRCLSTAADTLAGTCDNSPPVISDVVVTPDSVDTWEQDRTVKVTWRVTDDLTGIDTNNQHLSAYHEASNQFSYSGASVTTWPQMTGGDAHDATYEGILRIPRFSPQGAWSLDFQSGDKGGNRLRLEKSELLDLGLPTGFNQTGTGDDTKPVVSDFTIDRTTIDTSTSSQVVHVSARVTDTLSGVNLETTNGVSAGAGNLASKQSVGDTCERVSGDKFDGRYECTLTFPHYAAQGDWTYGIWVRDFAENSSGIGEKELPGLGLPRYIKQTGAGDTTPPKLVEFTISPTQIDTTSGPQTVNFQMRQTDNLSGISFEDGVSIPLAVNGAQSLLQADMFKTAGGSLDTTWEGSVTLPQGSVHGTWTPQFIVTMDKVGNYDMLSTSDMQKLGFPTSFLNGG